MMSLSFIRGKAGGHSDELPAVLLQPAGTDTADARSRSDVAYLTERRGKGCSCLLMPIIGMWGCLGGGQGKSKNRNKIYLHIQPSSSRVPGLLSGYL